MNNFKAELSPNKDSFKLMINQQHATVNDGNVTASLQGALSLEKVLELTEQKLQEDGLNPVLVEDTFDGLTAGDETWTIEYTQFEIKMLDENYGCKRF